MKKNEILTAFNAAYNLSFKVIFHKAANSDMLCEPLLFFRSDPLPFYQKYDDKVWKIVKEQLEKRVKITSVMGLDSWFFDSFPLM